MSSLLLDLIWLMWWWFVHQHSLLGYIFENILLLGDSRDKVLKCRHYVCQHLIDSIFVDAGSFGSYAHRPRWSWTNFASLSTLVVAFSSMPPPFDQKMDDILDSKWTYLPIVQDDIPPLALVNKVVAILASSP
jgi:hypothetical protein